VLDGNGSRSRKLAISVLIISRRILDAPFVDLVCSNLQAEQEVLQLVGLIRFRLKVFEGAPSRLSLLVFRVDRKVG
jgi:hypothetical protein